MRSEEGALLLPVRRNRGDLPKMLLTLALGKRLSSMESSAMVRASSPYKRTRRKKASMRAPVAHPPHRLGTRIHGLDMIYWHDILAGVQ
jgi:hypothetical protein